MATSPGTDALNDEVEFVSEGPLRPVLEFIDLLSDGEDEESKNVPETIEDHVDRKKAQVASTLDRLAKQVAVEKQRKAEKCKAFKEKMISQQAHGRQEVAFGQSSGNNRDAKHCVDMWLKMPGLKPGVLNSGSTRWRRSSEQTPGPSTVQTCPVINCGRIYDNAPLLLGHLKRFDHSPCDPTILLKGNPSTFYACVACCRQFDTEEACERHLHLKSSSHDPEGHVTSLTCQLIQCFACPVCCLLFSIRDACLQHMAAKNHFIRPSGSDSRRPTIPIPIPRYAKNRLIALCREVGFRVRCTSCKKVLGSHKEAQAHFNVSCRQGRAIAEADKSVLEVMKQLQALGRCTQCHKIFSDEDRIERHRQVTGHEVEVLKTVEQSILSYCNYHEMSQEQKAMSMSRSNGTSPKSPVKRRSVKGDSTGRLPAKRQKPSESPTGPRESGVDPALLWFCECGLSFPEESAASRHLMAANQVFHKCGVCAKLMSEAPIARLHMSRIHGGAHLSSFLFWCRQCRVDLPREQDVLSHVRGSHRSHTFYQEREATEEERHREERTSVAPEKPSTGVEPGRTNGPAAKRTKRWLCRMCEDLFESEAAVREHCGRVVSHSFQRFLCGICSQKFFKEATLRRHCETEHAGRLDTRHFCGLCDSMEQDSEEAFLQHYATMHSRDYCCVEDAPPSEGTTPPPEQLCPCMGIKMERTERNNAFTRCMKRLSGDGQCHYACDPCEMQTSSYVQIKVHVQQAHGRSAQGRAFTVTCGVCLQVHATVPAFHSHYHSQHCPQEPCSGRRSAGAAQKATVSASVTLNAQEVSPDTHAEEFEDLKQAILLSTEEATKMKSSTEDFEQDMKQALALSAEEGREPTDFDKDLEEAMKRSILEF